MHRVGDQITINIGEYYASKEPVIIKTILGSCVAACLHDPINKVGGMNHILLPGKADLNHFDARSRYAINAMELLINEIMKKGGARNNLVAKLFGGSNVISAIGNKFFVGNRNIAFVNEFLNKENINVISHDLGGTHTRVVHYHTRTGDAYVKLSKFKPLDQIVAKENQWSHKIEKKIKQEGRVEFFVEPKTNSR